MSNDLCNEPSVDAQIEENPFESGEVNKRFLRRDAEKRLLSMPDLEMDKLEAISPEAVRELLHELRVHQIELEMQNEELKTTQIELEIVKSRYFNFYDLAPEGYLILSDQSVILEANLTATLMFGYHFSQLIKKRISQLIVPSDQDTYYFFRKALFETLEPQTCEIQMIKHDYSLLWVKLTAKVILEEAHNKCLLIISDISRRKMTEALLWKEHDLFNAAILALKEGVIVTNAAGRITLMNPMAVTYTGYSLDEAVVQPFNKTVHMLDLQTRKESPDILHTILNSKLNIFERKNTGLVRKDGTEIYININATALRSPQGDVTGIVLSFLDISQEYEMVKQIDAFLEVNLNILCVTDFNGLFHKINAKFKEILGYDSDDLEGKSIYSIVCDSNVSATQDVLKNVENQTNVSDFINQCHCKNGDLKYIEWRFLPVVGKYIYFSAQDVTESIKQQELNKYFSYHDKLTGFYNRRFIEEEIARLEHSRKLPISIVMGDIDNLKEINDTLGHLKGDELITIAAEAIRSCCRPDDLYARWGGDEFILILPATSEVESQSIIDRIHHKLQSKQINSMPISISMGFGTKLNADQPLSDILIQADTAMYQAKTNKQL